MTENQFQISQFFSETTPYMSQNIQNKYVLLHGYGRIPRIYLPDQRQVGSLIQKYMHYSSHSKNKNTTEKYTNDV